MAITYLTHSQIGSKRDNMINFTDEIWNENDAEKRSYLWSYYLQQTDLSLKSLQLSPKYKEVKQRKSEYTSLLEFWDKFDKRNRQIVAIDTPNKQFIFKNPFETTNLSQVIYEVQNTYLPQLDKRINAFTDLKHFLYETIQFTPIGIEQSYYKEGYLFIRNTSSRFVKTYSYFISNYVNALERTLVKLNPLDEFTVSISYGLEQHKRSLNKTKSYYLNCYAVETDLELPLESTLIPIAKGKLSRHLKV